MPTYTNKWVNSEFVGAVTGVRGAGGVLPNLWGWPSSGGGLTSTIEIVSLTTTAGQLIIELQLDITNATGSDAYPNLTMGDISSVAGGTLHQMQIWAQEVSFTGTSYFKAFSGLEYSAGYGSFLSSDFSLYGLTSSFARGTPSVTTHASCAIFIPYIGYGLPTASSFSTRIKVAQPMFVQGSYLPSYIPTTSATPKSADAWPFRGHSRTYMEL